MVGVVTEFLVMLIAKFIAGNGAGEGEGEGLGDGDGDGLGEGDRLGLGEGEGELTTAAGHVPQEAWQKPPLTIAALVQPGQNVQAHFTLPQVSPAGWSSLQD